MESLQAFIDAPWSPILMIAVIIVIVLLVKSFRRKRKDGEEDSRTDSGLHD